MTYVRSETVTSVYGFIVETLRTKQHVSCIHVLQFHIRRFERPQFRHCRCRRGIVFSGVRRMNEVNARQAWLVPGWVTVFGRVYRLGM